MLMDEVKKKTKKFVKSTHVNLLNPGHKTKITQ